MAIIGIDLGTTNSAMAIYKNNNGEIIENRDGGRTTPSIFQLDYKGEIKVGPVAKREYSSYPNETVLEVKRMMGTDEKVSVSNEMYRPEEISSHILKYLKKSAEEHLDEVVNEAVITVPAYFSDSQRKATQKAGEIAGLKVDRIINEPTAAAIAYGLDKMDEDKNIIVYDLGGGTFDVSVVELFSGVLEVKASGGNSELGGMDFDRAIVDWMLEEVKKKENVDLLSLGNDQEILQRKARLKEAAEIAKISLSSQNSTIIHLPFIAVQNQSPISVDLELTRANFENMITPLIQSTMNKMEETLLEAELSMDDIDDLIFVGGSTRIPMIQEFIQKGYGRKARKDINPDEAVAMGAAIQAGIKSGAISSEDGLMVIDVCPYSLGIEVSQVVGGQLVPGYFGRIIPKNSPVPITESEVYYTTMDEQQQVNLCVYQGEGDPKYVKDAKLLSDGIVLDGIPPSPAGKQSIEVSFTYDINGTLQVESKILSTNQSFSDIIKTQTGVMSNEELSVSKQKIKEDWNNSDLYEDVKHVINRAEKVRQTVDKEKQEEIDHLLIKLKSGVEQGNATSVKKYENELTDLLIELI